MIKSEQVEKEWGAVEVNRGLKDLHSEQSGWTHGGVIQQWPVRPKDPEELIKHREMCKEELGISEAAGYDWRNPDSPRYKPELAGLAIYLSPNTVRFRRGDIRDFANKLRLGVRP